MKIQEIRTHTLAIPHRTKYNWALGAPEGSNVVLVEVVTDDGIVGYGDACGARSAVAVAAAIHDIEYLLVGEDPFRSEMLLARLYRRGYWSNERRFANQTFAGIEMALWDVCGKALGVPAYNLLGGRIHDEIPWFGFLMGDTPEDLAEDALRHVAGGFDPLYMKIGQGEAHDLASVAAVRRAVGDGPRLRVDANERWDRFTALNMIRRLAQFGIEWVEQPTPFDDIDGVALLRAQSPIPIALDQAIYTDADVLRAIRAGAADVIVLGFHESGGLLSYRKAAAVAAAGGIVINRKGLLGESGISTLAALQVLSAIPNLVDGHQVMHQLYTEDILVDGLISIEGGRTAVPDRPGLGIELDWDRVAKFERLFEQVGQYRM